MVSHYLCKVNDAYLPNSKYILYTPGPSAKKLPFQILACGHFYATSNYDVEREGLNHYVLILTLSGKGEIEHKNKHFYLEKGQAVVIDTEKYHHYKTYDSDWELLWVRFDCIPGIDYSQLINGESFEVISLDNTAVTETSIQKIIQLTEEHVPTADLSLSNLMSVILTELGIQKYRQSTSHLPSSAKKIIAEAVNYFQNNYAASIHITELAKKYHVSQYTFIRLFKKQTGLSPYEFLQTVRITQAKALLEQSDFTINEISSVIGFNDQNNFIREFKLLVGMTPLRYRNLANIPNISNE